VFFAFDLLYLNGKSTAQLPLIKRKERLERGEPTPRPAEVVRAWNRLLGTVHSSVMTIRCEGRGG
jgi:hypothetical protein